MPSCSLIGHWRRTSTQPTQNPGPVGLGAMERRRQLGTVRGPGLAPETFWKLSCLLLRASMSNTVIEHGSDLLFVCEVEMSILPARDRARHAHTESIRLCQAPPKSMGVFDRFLHRRTRVRETDDQAPFFAGRSTDSSFCCPCWPFISTRRLSSPADSSSLGQDRNTAARLAGGLHRRTAEALFLASRDAVFSGSNR